MDQLTNQLLDSVKIEFRKEKEKSLKTTQKVRFTERDIDSKRSSKVYSQDKILRRKPRKEDNIQKRFTRAKKFQTHRDDQQSKVTSILYQLRAQRFPQDVKQN